MKDTFKIIGKGACMGTADIIPGVSGGTLALLLNIYERLIAALKSINASVIFGILKNLAIWKEDKRKELFRIMEETDLFFLIRLGIGVASAIVVAGSIIPDLIVNHTEITLAFFLGLIIPSIYIPWSMMDKRRVQEFGFIALGLLITVGSSRWMKFNDSIFGSNYTFTVTAIVLFVSATIAISAMILPGISGSYILILLGQYFFVTGLLAKMTLDVLRFASEKISSDRLTNKISEIQAKKATTLKMVADYSFWETACLIGIFILGCIIGITLFSRLIHFCLEKSHNFVMAFLTGMITGSLYVLWPYKHEPTDPILLNMGKIKWLPLARNSAPDFAAKGVTASLVSFAIALVASAMLIRYGVKRNQQKEYVDAELDKLTDSKD